MRKSFAEWVAAAHPDFVLAEKNWIAGAVKHPGRCTPAPNPDCPKGSPQYNLAMRFKHGDLHKKKG